MKKICIAIFLKSSNTSDFSARTQNCLTINTNNLQTVFLAPTECTFKIPCEDLPLIKVADLNIATISEALLSETDADVFYFGEPSLAPSAKILAHFSGSLYEVQVFGGRDIFFWQKDGADGAIPKYFIYHLLSPDNILVSRHLLSKLAKCPSIDLNYVAQAAVEQCDSLCVLNKELSDLEGIQTVHVNAIINSFKYFYQECTINPIVSQHRKNLSQIIDPIFIAIKLTQLTAESAKIFVDFFGSQLDALDGAISEAMSLPFMAPWLNSIKSRNTEYFLSINSRIMKHQFFKTPPRETDFSGNGSLLTNPDFSYIKANLDQVSKKNTNILPITEQGSKQNYGKKFKLDYSIIGAGEFGRHRDGWNFVMQSLINRFPHNSDEVAFDGFIEKSFVWNYGMETVGRRKPWFGITHRPVEAPEFYGWKDKLKFYQSPYFNVHADYLCGLITVSSDHAQYLRSIFDIPVISILHPTNFNVAKWNVNSLNLGRIRVIQIGSWLRKMHSIFLMPSGNYEKCILAVKERLFADARFVAEARYLNERGYLNKKCYESVRFLGFVEDAQYDTLLANSVVFLDMYSATANNTVLECIARHTPIIVKRLPATVEYLGEGYPLFFNTLAEAASLASDRDLLLLAHEYLRDRSSLPDLHVEGFLDNFHSAFQQFV